jgi:hypothetical protein
LRSGFDGSKSRPVFPKFASQVGAIILEIETRRTLPMRNVNSSAVKAGVQEFSLVILQLNFELERSRYLCTEGW